MMYEIDWKIFRAEYLKLREQGVSHYEALKLLAEKYGKKKPPPD